MSKPHILIIDDDKELVRRYKEILGKADYSVGYAYDGKEGLEKLKTIGADLVILDLKMPRMGGIKVLEAIRDNPDLRKTKVVVISSYAYKDRYFHGFRVMTRAGRKAEDKGREKGGRDARIKVLPKQKPKMKEILYWGGKSEYPETQQEFQRRFKGWLLDTVEDALKRKPEALEREKAEDEPDRVLIVDDEKETVEKIASWLKPEGYELSFAYNGTEALEKISKEPIDLVILDLKMPETTGEDVIRITRSIPVVNDIPIVVFTSVDDTTTTDSLMDIMPTREFIDETNIRSRIHRYKHILGETYDKPEEDRLLKLLHLDKPRFFLNRVKKELKERRRLGCGYLKQPITILRNKKGRWLEGYLEAYEKCEVLLIPKECKCSYCEENKCPAYRSVLLSFVRYLCEDCVKELKAKYPSFA